MIERWVPAYGFSGYEVSDNGLVRSVDRMSVNALGRKVRFKGKVLSQQVRPNGYVDVYMGGKTVRVHRVVAASFFGFHEGLEVNHKNGVRNDNRSKNLEWLTRSENQKHAFRVLGAKVFNPSKGNFGSAHHRSKPVSATPVNGGKPIIFEGLHDAQRKTGLDVSNISATCRGKQKTCGGYIWRFA